MKPVYIKMDDDFMISAALYEKENPKALVQIIHGAVEHKGRYENFAAFLQKNGYAVIVTDNRGHGESVGAGYPLGRMDNVKRIVKDQAAVSEWIKDKYPGRKLYLVGHSLGTVFARCYLQENDAQIEKLVLSGTVPYKQASGVGILLGRVIVSLHGEDKCCELFRDLSGLGGKDDSWVVSDQASLEAYHKDPLCGYKYPNISTLTMIRAVKELHHWKAFKVHNPKLSIMSITGANDPITGGRKGLNSVKEDLLRLGYPEMINKVYDNMSHEVLNETEKEKVYQDVLRFFED